LKEKKEFDKGKESPRSKIARNIEYRLSKARVKNDILLIKEIIKERNKTTCKDFWNPSYKKLSYVRYADDFIIGIKGSYEEAKIIKDRTSEFLTRIGLMLNKEKSKITNINKERVLFLGTFIFRGKYRKYVVIDNVGNKRFKRRDALKLRFEAPLLRIIEKLKSTQFIAKGKSNPKFV